MGYVIAVVAVAVIAAVVGWALWRRSRVPPASPEPQRITRVTDAAPLTGLESALDQATDRSGRKLREKIEGTTAIDDLRVPEDTGPILRRALDQVEHIEHVEHVEHGAPSVAEPSGESPE